MAGWFELSKSSNDQFRFVLKAGNGEIILTSELYTTRAAAEKGIASVRVNSPQDAHYEKKTATNGKFHFNLKAGNHQVIGTSQLYASAAARDAGIESVQKNGPVRRIPMEGGTVFELGGRTIEVIHTPGHSLGSVCLLDRENRLLFTGDMCNDSLLLNCGDSSSTVKVYNESMRRLWAR